MLNGCEQATCVLTYIWRVLFTPPNQDFSGAKGRENTVKMTHQLVSICWNDRGDAMPVRACMSNFALAIVLAVYMTALAAAAQRTNPPDEQFLSQTVESYFASLSGYQRGDLITRSQIEKVIATLDGDGVRVPKADGIAKRGLADDSFLVRELSTAEGRRFMRKIARHGGAYSHLDRLSSIPRGQTLVRDLVRQKDGDKFIEYLATTKGGQNMGGMMSHARGGVNLNRPTDRIYTADDLIGALKTALAKTGP